MAQAGFILTRHWRDTPQGTEVSFWLATDNGPLQVTLAPQESVAFIPADHVPRAQHILQGEQGFRLTPLALKDFHRQLVYGLSTRPAVVWPLLSRPSPVDKLRKAPA